MGLLKIIKDLAGGGESAQGQNSRTYIVDIGGIDRGKTRRERMSPGVQVKHLQRLARFTQREEIPVSVLLEGKELRAVEHGGDFQGIKVYFEADGDAFAKTMLSLVRDRLSRHAVTVITDDAALDVAVQGAGGQAMRLSTFAKALDASTGPSDGNGSSRSDSSARRPRSRRRRNDPEPKPAVQGGDETVRDLIDLVD
jgi:hypothetical protein